MASGDPIDKMAQTPCTNAAPSRIRLYRYMAAKWALKSIETRELRVGRLVELNDPFEFVPGIEGLRDHAPIEIVREQLWQIQTDLNAKIGLLSFSSTPNEPTLWSHYAESHKGIALGFDIASDRLVLDQVKYPDPPKRPAIHPGNPDLSAWMDCVFKTLTTKALGWKMESEYRVFVHFACTNCRFETGNHFLPIADNACALMEVILGCKCSLDENCVNQALKQSGFTDVRVVRAKLSVDTFQVEC
jgi:Protein of unknown function (DUF2971)